MKFYSAAFIAFSNLVGGAVGALDKEAFRKKVQELNRAHSEQIERKLQDTANATTSTTVADAYGYGSLNAGDVEQAALNLEKTLLKAYCSKKKKFYKTKYRKPAFPPKSGHKGGYEYDEYGRELYGGGYGGSSSHDVKCPAIDEDCGCTFDLSVVVDFYCIEECLMKPIPNTGIESAAPLLLDPCFLLHVDDEDEVDVDDLKEVGLYSYTNIVSSSPVEIGRKLADLRPLFLSLNAISGVKRHGCFDIQAQAIRYEDGPPVVDSEFHTWADVIQFYQDNGRNLITAGAAYAPDGSQFYIDGGYQIRLPVSTNFEVPDGDILEVSLLYTYYCVDGSSVDSSCDVLQKTLFPPKATTSSYGKRGESIGKKGGGKKGESNGKKGHAGKKSESDGKKGHGKKGESAAASYYGDNDDDYSSGYGYGGYYDNYDDRK
jgi:hypothetical protein